MTNPGDGTTYNFAGCYTDSVSNRTLKSYVDIANTPGSTTVAKCVSACKSQNYPFAGVEYGGGMFDTDIARLDVS